MISKWWAIRLNNPHLCTQKLLNYRNIISCLDNKNLKMTPVTQNKCYLKFSWISLAKSFGWASEFLMTAEEEEILRLPADGWSGFFPICLFSKTHPAPPLLVPIKVTESLLGNESMNQSGFAVTFTHHTFLFSASLLHFFTASESALFVPALQVIGVFFYDNSSVHLNLSWSTWVVFYWHMRSVFLLSKQSSPSEFQSAGCSAVIEFTLCPFYVCGVCLCLGVEL